MRYLLLIFVFAIACSPKEEKLFSLSDLKAGERAEIMVIELPEGEDMDKDLNKRMFKMLGVEIGAVLTARGPKEAKKGIIFGFDVDEGKYFGLYEPQAKMVKVSRLE